MDRPGLTAGPALLAVRSAVLAALDDVDGLCLVGCSGGADSLALAAGASLAPRRIGAVVVDHRLQEGSAGTAGRAAEQCRTLGLAPVLTIPVTVSGPGGPEAAARHARQAAFRSALGETGAAAVLLAHTMDDQAETVLLRLSRGAGARSLAGMAVRDGAYVRPLLGLRRQTVREACAEAGLVPAEDPHNRDDRFARSRLRHHGLPALIRDLGQDVVPPLSRTAASLRDDNEALDAWAADTFDRLRLADDALDLRSLSGLPAAIRRRVLRLFCLVNGVRGGALADSHLRSLDALATTWHGQGPVDLPGGVRARRLSGTLVLSPAGQQEERT